jgi:hypothetical protein
MTHEVTPTLLRAVAARAAGHMQALMLSDLAKDPDEDALLDVVQANGAALRVLDISLPDEREATCYPVFYPLAQVERVLRTAPQLQMYRSALYLLRSHMTSPTREAVRILRNEAPFGPLRVRSLFLMNTPVGGVQQGERVDDADMLALFAAMSEHALMTSLVLMDVALDTPAVLDALIDAALAQRFSMLSVMHQCSLSPASIPAFVRLLGGGALTRLLIAGGRRLLLDAPAALLLADALRANTTLRMLKLRSVRLWADAEAGVALMTALTAHPSIQTLALLDNTVHADAAAAVGAALGALVAANAPTLCKLDVAHSSLGDAGLAPLIDALQRNTHLRTLCCGDNGMSAAFARDTFLPAIRANTTLRELADGAWWGGVEGGIAPDEVLEAEAIVKARADADAAADAAA